MATWRVVNRPHVQFVDMKYLIFYPYRYIFLDLHLSTFPFLDKYLCVPLLYAYMLTYLLKYWYIYIRVEARHLKKNLYITIAMS